MPRLISNSQQRLSIPKALNLINNNFKSNTKIETMVRDKRNNLVIVKKKIQSGKPITLEEIKNQLINDKIIRQQPQEGGLKIRRIVSSTYRRPDSTEPLRTIAHHLNKVYHQPRSISQTNIREPEQGPNLIINELDGFNGEEDSQILVQD